MRHKFNKAAVKGFLVKHRSLADSVFKDHFPSDVYRLVVMVRAAKLYSQKTSAETILDSLFMVRLELDR